jgi:hypothetical protein
MGVIKKSTVVFDLKFTTSKLLAYIIVIASALLGYSLSSTEIVIVGFTIGCALSGVKSVLESRNGNITSIPTDTPTNDNETDK